MQVQCKEMQELVELVGSWLSKESLLCPSWTGLHRVLSALEFLHFQSQPCGS